MAATPPVHPDRWSRRWVALAAHAGLLQCTVFVVRPTISYQGIALGVPSAWLGCLAACFTIVPLGIAIPAGRLADRRGERSVLVVGAALLVAASLSFVVLGGTLPVLVGASVLLGCGHLLTMLGQQSVVAAGGAGRDLVHAFGRFTLAQSLGQAVGPVLMGLVGGQAARPDTVRLFLTGAGAAAGLAVVTSFLGARGRPSGKERPPGGAVRAVLAVPDLRIAILASLTVIASVDLLVVYLPVLGTERHLATSIVGALLTVRALASMASRVFLSRWVRRFGREPVLLASLAGAAVSLALLPLGPGVAVLLVIVVVVGLTLGVGQPMTMAWVAERAPDAVRGTALSLRLSGNRLGQTVLPAVAGLCTAGWGAAGVFWAMAAALGLTGVLTRSALAWQTRTD
jgi:MFS family permease